MTAELNLPLAMLDGSRDGWVVSAQVVAVAPHLANVATFALHNSWEFFGPDGEHLYVVSNIETGSLASRAYVSADTAVEDAICQLAPFDARTMQQMLDKINNGLLTEVRK